MPPGPQVSWPSAVLQRDLLVLLAHGVLADADVGEHEVDAGEGGLGIGGVVELDLGGVLAEVDLAGLGHDLLALGVVVVEGDLVNREAVMLLEQHQSDARREGGTAAGNSNCIRLLGHDESVLLVPGRKVQEKRAAATGNSAPALRRRRSAPGGSAKRLARSSPGGPEGPGNTRTRSSSGASASAGKRLGAPPVC